MQQRRSDMEAIGVLANACDDMLTSQILASMVRPDFSKRDSLLIAVLHGLVVSGFSPEVSKHRRRQAS